MPSLNGRVRRREWRRMYGWRVEAGLDDDRDDDVSDRSLRRVVEPLQTIAQPVTQSVLFLPSSAPHRATSQPRHLLGGRSASGRTRAGETGRAGWRCWRWRWRWLLVACLMGWDGWMDGWMAGWDGMDGMAAIPSHGTTAMHHISFFVRARLLDVARP